MNKQDMRIVFINQYCSALFKELAEDLSNVWSPSLLYTNPIGAAPAENGKLFVKTAPRYNRTNNVTRLFSWLSYFFAAFFVIFKTSPNALIFIVSNPPFAGFLGLLFKLLRKQQYVVLIYDIYPDLLVNLGKLRKGVISTAWDVVNKIVFRNASAIITISGDMATVLQNKLCCSTTGIDKIFAIPNWVDVGHIYPIAKDSNWFACQHGLADKFTVLYSGNMGHTHDMESIIDVAISLKSESRIHFLLIGDGAKRNYVLKSIVDHKLSNVTVLTFQPEEVLPYSLAAGDIGIVSYQPGTEYCIVPSKACYYMSAGVVPFVISSKETELTKMVQRYHCGIRVANKDIDGMTQTILELSSNPALLTSYKTAARRTAVEMFSRSNTQRIADVVRPLLF